jgi:hypothetical protein
MEKIREANASREFVVYFLTTVLLVMTGSFDVRQMPYDGFGDGVCVFAKYPLAAIPG